MKRAEENTFWTNWGLNRIEKNEGLPHCKQSTDKFIQTPSGFNWLLKQ
jgi:hypothetical protein